MDCCEPSNTHVAANKNHCTNLRIFPYINIMANDGLGLYIDEISNIHIRADRKMWRKEAAFSHIHALIEICPSANGNEERVFIKQGLGIEVSCLWATNCTDKSFTRLRLVAHGVTQDGQAAVKGIQHVWTVVEEALDGPFFVVSLIRLHLRQSFTPPSSSADD